jgi:hypothetical protein
VLLSLLLLYAEMDKNLIPVSCKLSPGIKIALFFRSKQSKHWYNNKSGRQQNSKNKTNKKIRKQLKN